jgi:hypothetical protein
MPETTPMPPGAPFVIALILLSAAGFILILIYKVLLWLESRRPMDEEIEDDVLTRRPRPLLPARRWMRVMSRSAARTMAQVSTQNTAVSVAKLTGETAEIPQRVAENSAETFTFGETQALARLVAAGKLGLTDAVKIGADAKSGEKYQKRSQEIKAAVARLQQKYPELNPDRQQVLKQKGALT